MSEAAFLALAETLTRALVSGDYPLYRGVFRLPVTIVPRSAEPYVLDSEEALERDYDLYRIAIQTEGITDIVRRIRSLHYVEEDRMRIEAEVNILRKAERVVAPFLSQFHLIWDEADGWLIHAIESAIGHIRWTLGQGRLDDI